MCAYSIGSYFVQIPVGDRKSGTPDSVLMPAPVSTTHGRFSRISCARASILAAMEGFTFETTVRVRFHDTDAQGIVHNSNYLVWFEIARVEYLRKHTGGYQALRDRGIEALVLESRCRYLQPAKFDDVLHLHTRCVGMRGARFRFEYAIVRDDGTIVADGHTEHACVDARTLRPTRVPEWLRAAVEAAEAASTSSPA
jgi:acyl-CoA thioester hydrolase